MCHFVNRTIWKWLRQTLTYHNDSQNAGDDKYKVSEAIQFWQGILQNTKSSFHVTMLMKDRTLETQYRKTLYLHSVGSLQWIFPPAEGNKKRRENSNSNVDIALWGLSVHKRCYTNMVVKSQEAVTC